MKNRSYVLIGAVVLLAIFAGMLPAQDEKVGAVGSQVLDFTLKTYDGKTFTTADMKGKVTMLMFWFPT